MKPPTAPLTAHPPPPPIPGCFFLHISIYASLCPKATIAFIFFYYITSNSAFNILNSDVVQLCCVRATPGGRCRTWPERGSIPLTQLQIHVKYCCLLEPLKPRR